VQKAVSEAAGSSSLASSIARLLVVDRARMLNDQIAVRRFSSP
jgi:hypothetical protein